jgi:hypothetical protein
MRRTGCHKERLLIHRPQVLPNPEITSNSQTPSQHLTETHAHQRPRPPTLLAIVRKSFRPDQKFLSRHHDSSLLPLQGERQPPQKWQKRPADSRLWRHKAVPKVHPRRDESQLQHHVVCHRVPPHLTTHSSQPPRYSPGRCRHPRKQARRRQTDLRSSVSDPPPKQNTQHQTCSDYQRETLPRRT